MGSRSFIICCVYFPSVTSSHDYKVELSHCTGFINSIASAGYLSEIIVIGDMNFSCHTHNTGLETFKEELSLTLNIIIMIILTHIFVVKVLLNFGRFGTENFQNPWIKKFL